MVHIARWFLFPTQLTQNGLSEAHVQLAKPALLQPDTRYTQESGVRSLDHAIGGIVRFKAVEWAAHVDKGALGSFECVGKKRSKDGDTGYNYIVEADELEKILGLSRYDSEDR